MPMPVATRGGSRRASSRMPTAAPKTMPKIWVTQDSRDSVKVGWTAAMAPSMAKMILEVVAP